MNNSITIKEMNKNEVFKAESGELVVRIKYPAVLCEKDAPKRILKLCKNMNEYYSRAAQVLYEKAKKIVACRNKNKRAGAHGKNEIEMNFRTALKNDDIVSIVLDITFEGKRGVRKKRFSQSWSVKDGLIVPSGLLIKMTYGTRKKVRSLVLEKAGQNAKNAAFGYYPDYSARLVRALSLRRFFVTEKGIAFYVDAGVIADIKHGSFAFVVEFDNLKECLKGDLCKEIKDTCNANDKEK